MANTDALHEYEELHLLKSAAQFCEVIASSQMGLHHNRLNKILEPK
jgi:hypothetical protein